MSQKKLVSEQLVPADILARAEKILFVTHLAIGDFTYQQNGFRAFAEKYPHIKIDLWVDERGRTRCFWLWPAMKNFVLFDWLRQSGLFNKLYTGSYSPARFKKLFQAAQKENYSLVVSLCSLDPERYAAYARKISPEGFVAGAIDLELSPDPNAHISDICANWFEQFFGLQILPEQRAPYVNIPKEWMSYAKLKFVQWGIYKGKQKRLPVIFINVFAKNIKRCWPLDSLTSLLKFLKQDAALRDASFIVNVEPRFYDQVDAFLKNYSLRNVFLFTATESFFQLPSIISLCDLVISVETSIMHLAAAREIPVIALMRKKNPAWVPYQSAKTNVIFAKNRKGWVEDIPVSRVVQATKLFFQES
ncbi:glycosyltransferase family 9 protein [Candidatus Babeliales bacterium]|nr:glycosyltransferase family 9 protein [Candidatus Babeliales bacterium]